MRSQALNVFDVLPLLLHINHAAIPGFIEQEVVGGIAGFFPTRKQLDFIADCVLLSESEDSPQSSFKNSAIKGVYAMGSTSSLGQSQTSDLDIWVCVQPWVTKTEQVVLEQKCTRISSWAMAQGVEVNFFVMTEQRFRVQVDEEMTSEHCGTSQHYLLLDEFYRSAIHLAGLPLLWYLVPPEREHEYEQYIDALVKECVIYPQEWIDFGGIPAIPAEEYFGSSLWQLYKSIDSPYKSVLKAILLEAYSWEYPNTNFLALEFKKHFFAGELEHNHTDAYLMVLNRVTGYLEATHDMRRLDLVRRCFYLKTHEKLSRAPKPEEVLWRREMLTTLVKDWGWSQARLKHQDNRRFWKVREVKKTHIELLKALMLSYRNLIRFARRNNITSAISPEDISILARKLYAAFEVLPGKVTLLNSQLASDLHEDNLSFIKVPENHNILAGWYLYKQSLVPRDIIGQASLEHNRYISKLVAWAYFNGLLTDFTQLHLVERDGHLNASKLDRFVVDIRQTFKLKRDKASRKSLSEPCEIRKLAIFINLEQDPTTELTIPSYQLSYKNADVFSYGANQACLIGSVDLIYINSWNEVRTLHFKGDGAVLDMLKTLLGKMHQDAIIPESVDVFCYAEKKQNEIKEQVQKLVRECIDMRLNPSEQKFFSRFKILKITSQVFSIIFERRGVSVQRLDNDNKMDFYSTLSNIKIGESPLFLLNEADARPPEVVDAFASEGLIQFFFEDCAVGFNIYVLDENNKVEVYRQCRGQKKEMVQGLNRFYTSPQSTNNHQDDAVNFNLPQFYHIIQQNGRDQVVPYKSERQSIKQ